MIADRRDFEATFKEKHDRKRQELMPLMRLVAGAAPVMEALTAGQEWTRYQQILQGLVDKWKAQRDSARDKLGSAQLSDVELRKLNTDVVGANAAIAAWEMALQLPRAIASGADEANQVIAEFEKKNEITADPKP